MQSGRMINAIEMPSNGRRPFLINSLLELRAPMEAALFWVNGIRHPWPHAEEGNRKSVMLIPGFMASDMSLVPLATLCGWLGHKTFFTGIRSNSNCPRETLADLEYHLERISERVRARVTIVGQSLGGVYARELAARLPDLVERVVTLGSPIRFVEEMSNPLVTAMAKLIARTRNMDEGCFSQSCPCGMGIVERESVDVPTTVIFSRTDGVVHWESCIDRSGANNVENIEVMASHCGMGINSDVLRVVADRLASPPRASASRPVPAV
jgi:hypothetical protein